MGRLLECVKDDSRMVAQKTEEALEALIHAISPPQRCLQVLIPIIISEQAPVLQAAIRTLSKLVPRIPTEALLEALPSMLPGLFEVRIMDHSHRGSRRLRSSICFLHWHSSQRHRRARPYSNTAGGEG